MRIQLSLLFCAGVLLALAGCTGADDTVRVSSQVLPDVMAKMGMSSSRIDDALVHSGDELTRVRELTNATVDDIDAVAQQLDTTTTVPQRVGQAVEGLDPETAAKVVDVACKADDAASDLADWDIMSEEEKAEAILEHTGLGGADPGELVSEVEEVLTALRAGEDVAATLATLSLCSAASAAAAGE